MWPPVDANLRAPEPAHYTLMHRNAATRADETERRGVGVKRTAFMRSGRGEDRRRRAGRGRQRGPETTQCTVPTLLSTPTQPLQSCSVRLLGMRFDARFILADRIH